MNFPPGGGSPPTPTHQPIDMMSLYELFGSIREIAEGGVVTITAIEDLAEREGVPRTHAYAAMMFDPTIALETEGSTSINVCTGRCQMFGAIDVLEELLVARDTRKANGDSPLNVIPRSCLDQCDFPPVLMSKSPNGLCTHRFAKSAELPEIIEAICSED